MSLRRTAISILVLAAAAPAHAYCPASGNTAYEYLESVTIDTTTVASGNNQGYFDGSSDDIPLASRSFSVTLTAGYPGSQYVEQFAVYVDLDRSDSFDPGELVFEGSGTSVTGSIGLPPEALAGATRLRVVMNWGRLLPDACTAPNWGEVEDYTIVVPEEAEPPALEQMPWQDHGPAPTGVDVGWHYALGYHFTVAQDGLITALGGLFDGTKMVRLFDRDTGELLEAVEVAGDNQWRYGALPAPREVAAGETYTVAVYLQGSGGAYTYPLPYTLPQTFGSIRVDGTTYIHTGSVVDDTVLRPVNSVANAMYGLADIRFEVSVEDPASHTCTTDDTSALTWSGELSVGPMADLVPLCSGRVLVADIASPASVKLYNVTDGTLEATYPLPGTPVDLDLDAANGWLYVALDATPGVARLDLETGAVTTIATLPALAVAAGDGTTAFAIVQEEDAPWWERPIVILDGATDTLVDTFDPGSQARGAQLLEWDAANGKLFTGDLGFSPSSLTRYGFDGATLTEEEHRSNAGGNGQDLVVSPDGDRLAFPTGGGNGSGYTMFDFDPLELAPPGDVFDEWVTGAYPASAAFTPDSSTMVGMNYDDLIEFDTAAHLEIQRHSPPLADCSYSRLELVRFSRGGTIAYAFSNCGFDDAAGRLVWWVP